MSLGGRLYGESTPGVTRLESTLQGGVRHRFIVGKHEVPFAISSRLDPANPDRNRFDIDEFAWFAEWGALALEMGVREVSWGVLESQRFVDVINQHDPERRWPGSDKLGQPMLGVSWTPRWGKAEILLLPWFRARPFDGRRGRLWSPITIDASGGRPDGTTATHVALATRWSLKTGRWDVGASYFGGLRRDPRFEVANPPAPPDVFTPVYDRVHQVGLDAQYVGPAVLWRLEIVTSDPAMGRYLSVGSGIEYAPRPYLSFFAEFLFDGQGRQAATSLERDLFVGGRVHYQDGRITGGVFLDVASGNRIMAFEVTRRVGSTLELGVDFRSFMGDAEQEPPHALREDGAISVVLRRYY